MLIMMLMVKAMVNLLQGARLAALILQELGQVFDPE